MNVHKSHFVARFFSDALKLLVGLFWAGATLFAISLLWRLLLLLPWQLLLMLQFPLMLLTCLTYGWVLGFLSKFWTTRIISFFLAFAVPTLISCWQYQLATQQSSSSPLTDRIVLIGAAIIIVATSIAGWLLQQRTEEGIPPKRLRTQA